MTAFDPIVRVSTDLNAVSTAEWNSYLSDRILEFEFVDKARGADEAKLTMWNGDQELLDHPALTPDSELVVLYGYPHETRTVRLTIKKVEGFWKLSVKGPANGAANFLGSQRTRSFDGSTEWEVAEDIARGLGYTSSDSLSIDTGGMPEVRRGISQVGETDWAFLGRLADRVDAVVFVRDGVFHFHPPSLEARPAKTITFFDSLNGDFLEPPNIEYGVIGRSGRAQVAGVSTEERAEVRGEASNSTDTDRPCLGDRLAIQEAASTFDSVLDQELGFRTPGSLGPEESQMSIDPSVAQSDEEAARRARRNFRGSERESVKLTAKLVGDVGYIADETIRIEGLGQRFSGNYLLDEVTHNFSPAYSSNIKGRRNAVSRSRRNASGSDENTPTRTGEEASADVEFNRASDEALGFVNDANVSRAAWDRFPAVDEVE